MHPWLSQIDSLCIFDVTLCLSHFTFPILHDLLFCYFFAVLSAIFLSFFSVVATVLSEPALFAEWKVELKGMADRIIQMREALFGELKRLNTPGDWKHIITQIGMFSFTGLTPKQCEVLTTKHHIYLLSNGRISMCGITTKNVKYLAAAINDVVVNVKA